MTRHMPAQSESECDMWVSAWHIKRNIQREMRSGMDQSENI